jgi:hypothetical protein
MTALLIIDEGWGKTFVRDLSFFAVSVGGCLESAIFDSPFYYPCCVSERFFEYSEFCGL